MIFHWATKPSCRRLKAIKWNKKKLAPENKRNDLNKYNFVVPCLGSFFLMSSSGEKFRHEMDFREFLNQLQLKCLGEKGGEINFASCNVFSALRSEITKQHFPQNWNIFQSFQSFRFDEKRQNLIRRNFSGVTKIGKQEKWKVFIKNNFHQIAIVRRNVCLTTTKNQLSQKLSTWIMHFNVSLIASKIDFVARSLNSISHKSVAHHSSPGYNNAKRNT